MKEKILKNRKLIDVFIIILVACILGIPLLNSKLNVYYDDGIQHIARAFGTFESIKQNGILANVITSFANNFGYSWNLFYGPLSTYGIIIINLLCNNFIVAYKIFALLILILSGYFMYKFMLAFTKNNNVSILASILYMSFPYHLTDLYTRNALGEYMSFIFIPIVFLGLYNLFYTNKKSYYIAIGAIGLILTHNLSTIMVALFAFLYFIANIKKLKEKNVRKGLIINIIFIVLTTSFFWVPLLETKLATNYHVYETNAMSSSVDTANSGLSITQLFVTKNDGSYVFELGLHIIVMLGLSVMAFRIIDDELKSTYDFFLIAAILTLWMVTKYFPWKILPECFSIIQFPWRFLELTAFFLSVVCSINMYTIIKKFNLKDVIVISVIAILYVSSFIGMLNYDENITDINNYELGKISGKVSETVAGTAKAEYLPEKAYNNRFYIATREDATYVIKGKAIIENEEKTDGKYKANITTLDAEYTIFELPYIYYPGYEVRIDGMLTDTFETENGFLGIVLGAEDTVKLEVNYSGTLAMKISAIVSLISFIVFCLYISKNTIKSAKFSLKLEKKSKV